MADRLGPQDLRYLSLVFPSLVSTTLVSYKQSFLSFEDMHNINANLKMALFSKLWDFNKWKIAFMIEKAGVLMILFGHLKMRIISVSVNYYNIIWHISTE